MDLYDIRKFDAALGATLEKLYAAHKAHQAQGGSRKGPMLVDGCPIEDLCLTFVLPGYPEYELKKNGGEIMVDATNVGAYISAVVDANLESGIKTQMDHFRQATLMLVCNACDCHVLKIILHVEGCMVLYQCSERSALLEYSRLDLQDVLFLLRGRSVPISFVVRK